MTENSELRAQVEELKFEVIMAKSDAASRPESASGDLASLVDSLKRSNQDFVSKMEIAKTNEQKLLKQLEDLRYALATHKVPMVSQGPGL